MAPTGAAVTTEQTGGAGDAQAGSVAQDQQINILCEGLLHPLTCIIYSCFWVQLGRSQAVLAGCRGIWKWVRAFLMVLTFKTQFQSQDPALSLPSPLPDTQTNTVGRSLKFVSNYTDFPPLRAHSNVCIGQN